MIRIEPRTTPAKTVSKIPHLIINTFMGSGSSILIIGALKILSCSVLLFFLYIYLYETNISDMEVRSNPLKTEIQRVILSVNS